MMKTHECVVVGIAFKVKIQFTNMIKILKKLISISQMLQELKTSQRWKKLVIHVYFPLWRISNVCQWKQPASVKLKSVNPFELWTTWGLAQILSLSELFQFCSGHTKKVVIATKLKVCQCKVQSMFADEESCFLDRSLHKKTFGKCEKQIFFRYISWKHHNKCSSYKG